MINPSITGYKKLVETTVSANSVAWTGQLSEDSVTMLVKIADMFCNSDAK